MQIKDEIKKLEEIANEKIGDPYGEADINDVIAIAEGNGATNQARDALKIINKLMEVVEMQQESLKYYASGQHAYHNGHCVIIEDKGRRAQEALEKSKQLSEGE